MRKDVIEGVKYYPMNDIKPNFAALARDYDCDPRTVKSAYERLKSGQEKTEKKAKKSILDPYKELIKGKLLTSSRNRHFLPISFPQILLDKIRHFIPKKEPIQLYFCSIN